MQPPRRRHGRNVPSATRRPPNMEGRNAPRPAQACPHASRRSRNVAVFTKQPEAAVVTALVRHATVPIPSRSRQYNNVARQPPR